MLEAIALCEQIAGRELDWELGRTTAIGDHRWWISDLAEFRRDYPGWQLELRRRGDPARDPRAQRRGLEPSPDEALGRHPGTQRGRLDRGRRWPLADRLDAEGVDYEILVGRRREQRRDGEQSSERSAERTPAIRATARTTRRASASRSARGSTSSRATRSAIVMADGSDCPEDLVDYYRVLEQGYDCAFGSRFVRGARSSTTRA